MTGYVGRGTSNYPLIEGRFFELFLLELNPNYNNDNDDDDDDNNNNNKNKNKTFCHKNTGNLQSESSMKICRMFCTCCVEHVQNYPPIIAGF